MSETNTNKETEKFEFIRVFTPQHIPTYLIEQVKDRDFTVEQFYEYQEINCTRKTEHGPILNPLNLLYVIVNSKKITKGFCWMVIDPLTKDLILQTYSMDKEYWGKCGLVNLLSDKIKEIMKECHLNKAYWITKYPKHSQRYGFKPSKHVLMEYKETDNGQNDKSCSSGTGESVESRADAVHQQSDQ